MRTNPLSDSAIISSWHRNVAAWTTAVRERQIESRRLVTDQAIIDAASSRPAGSVIDLGCGEGWLARALVTSGRRVLGIDVVPDLIDAARAAGGGADYAVLAYEQLDSAGLVPADLVVCNFALLGEESAQRVFEAAPALLKANGTFIIQTLHPITACGDLPYQDGWRTGSWAGFDPRFVDPAPWYFRTLSGWLALFRQHGLTLVELREPLHPHTGKPASIIFLAQVSPH